MFETRGSAAIATMSDLKARARETVERAQRKPVYLLRDGHPIGGVVNMEMMELLYDVLEERYITNIAAARLDAIRSGDDDLLDEDEFWARADAIMADRG
jgi:hypothetical protein